MKRSCCVDSLNQLINDFLERNSVRSPDASWIVKKSDLNGFGVFAKRDIQVGELIFKDHAVILGPRTVVKSPLCVKCYSKLNLKQCPNCFLPLCSKECQKSSLHQKECELLKQWRRSGEISEDYSNKLLKSLTPVRSLLLEEDDKEIVRCLKAHMGDQHGFEVDLLKNELSLNINEEEEHFLRFVCSVLDSNAFEVIVGNEEKQSSLRGLYPLGSLANHSCVPNASHVFDKDRKMVVRAAVFIPKNSEIFHSYSRTIWGTTTRRYHLYKTKHFMCKCARCSDPTEFGSYMSCILCKKCKGNVVAVDAFKSARWRCQDCGECVTQRDVGHVTSLLGSTLSSFEDDDLKFILKFIDGKLKELVPKYNEVAVELKYRVIWILGYNPGLTWKELPIDLLVTKEQFCRDLLFLLDILKLGQCKMRGLLLYELYRTLKELQNPKNMNLPNNNKNTQNLGNEMKNCLDEAADILLYDVSAPKEVQQKWTLMIL